MSLTKESNTENYIKSLSNIFVGRQDEIDSVVREYDNVLNGNIGVVAVCGAPGIGKTCFVDHAINLLSENNYVYGKSLQDDNSGLESIANIANQLVSYLSTLPITTFRVLKQELINTIGEDLEFISAISDVFNKTFGINSNISIKDFSKAKYRFKSAMISFISIASSYLFPLIVHIDDLQWANQIVLDLVKSILRKQSEINLLLIISFRNNTINDKLTKIKRLISSCCTITINGLDINNIRVYLEHAFGKEFQNSKQLSHLIYGFTQGNPFFIKELIKILLSEKILLYSSKSSKWKLDVDKVSKFKVSNDLENIFKSNFIKVYKNHYELLNILACLGGICDYNILKHVSNMDTNILENNLESLSHNSVLLRINENNTRKIMFSHDIIYSTVTQSLKSSEVESTHFMIANKMLTFESSNYTNKDLILSTHLLKSNKTSLFKTSHKWIISLYNAGTYNMKISLIENALEIFKLCKELLTGGDQVDEKLYVDIHLKLAECLYLSNEINKSSEIIEELETTTKNVDLVISIKNLKLNIHHYSRDHKQVISLGIEILKLLRVRYGKFWLLYDLIATRVMFRKKKIELLKFESTVPSHKAAIAFNTLILMNSSATLIGDSSQACIGLTSSMLSNKYPNDPNVFVGYISYAYVLYSVWNGKKTADAMKEKILDLLNSSTKNSNKAMIYFIIGAFLSHWCESIKQADYYLNESIKFGEMIGDFAFIGYSITTSLDTKSFMGLSLDSLKNFIARCQQSYPEIEQYVTTYNYMCHLNHIKFFKEGSNKINYNKIGQMYPKLTTFERLTEETLAMEQCIFTDNIDLGYSIVEHVTPKIKLTKGLICRISIMFNCAMIRIAKNSELTGVDSKKNIKKIKIILKEIKNISEMQNDNFYSYYKLLLAEYEIQINQNANDAIEYNNSIKAAKESGNQKIASLASIKAAHFYNFDKELSEYYATQAILHLENWGAKYICKIVKRKFNINSKSSSIKNKHETKAKSLFELTSFTKKIHNSSRELATKVLLESVLKLFNANYCCLIAEVKDDLYLTNEISHKKPYTSFQNTLNINYIPNISHRIVRYVGRTMQEAFASANNRNPIFSNDSYFNSKPSINVYCFPITYQSILTGVIYIESNSPVEGEVITMLRSMLPVYIIKQLKTSSNIAKPNHTYNNLTKRELEILHSVSKGLSNAEICEVYNIALSTTKKHINSIMTKLNANNRLKAVNTAKEKGII